MKTYRQREKQGSKVQESTKGPDEAKIKVNKVMWLSFILEVQFTIVVSVYDRYSSVNVYHLCISGSLRPDRIHPGCHHRTKKIWRSPT